MNKGKRLRTALILNIAAFAIGAYGLIARYIRSPGDFFGYYTQLSNVLGVISSGLYIAMFRARGKKARGLTAAVRYTGACGLTMTFFVVMFIFIPFGGSLNRLILSDTAFIHHALCPVISVVSYVFFEEGCTYRGAVLLPVGATAVYGFVMITLNALRLAEGPYPFFLVYENGALASVMWFLGLLLLVGAISAGVKLANKRFSVKNK